MVVSSFCGIIDEIPGIRVDNFENADRIRARAYFLSHCHSDHTQGLFNNVLCTTLEETGASIYMSEPTAAIINDEKTDMRISKYIKVLPMGTSSIMLPSDPERNLQEQYVKVSLIPASHSFGSVMFLFRTDRKTILFTGDFRMPPNDLPKYGHFHKNNEPKSIDAMYVDTTFIKHKYLNFPKRGESVDRTVEVIKEWLETEGNAVALHTSAKYGYEFVFNRIKEKLGLEVYVNNERWKLYSTLQHLVPGVTNDENSTRIHICRNWSENKDHSNCIKKKHHTNFLYIHFSAMKWDNFNIDDNAVARSSDNRLDVCFATHCSFGELIYFVNYLSPKKVIGFPEEFPKELLTSKKCHVTESTKQSVRRTPTKRKASKDDRKLAPYKVDKDSVKKIFDI